MQVLHHFERGVWEYGDLEMRCNDEIHAHSVGGGQGLEMTYLRARQLLPQGESET